MRVIGLDLPSIAARFWPKVTPVPSGCWEWTATRNHHGYGKFSVGSRMEFAHRIPHLLLNGALPPRGYEVDHLCRNRSCVNPNHHQIVTHAENSRRSSAGEVNRARQLAVTHCPQGHPYDETNTSRRRDGRRRCKTCMREYSARRMEALRCA